ncbi:MAG: hypothetical protein ISR82_08285 [Candidatus Marinimicrobia bacterium]|nr:hypothetical protein [Candidatus Neomarinimicrobiota bacterium]MBL7011204.1 hypothetical protein [Candidatus Neomarinimicrobiota bacterium]MBL7031365.1 hypothetical protein [Candidatus Neomarinimicrobiota bacterium]
MKAYLSGAMEFASDEGAGWREDMTLWLDKTVGHSVYNPVLESEALVKEYGAESYRDWKKNDIQKYSDFIRVCVNRDIDIVRNKTDYLICLWDEGVLKGAGTHAEVTIAYECGKPVYLVNKFPVEDLSGWIMACSTEIFSEFDELKIFLADQYSLMQD